MDTDTGNWDSPHHHCAAAGSRRQQSGKTQFKEQFHSLSSFLVGILNL
jgi:hypothetical protein